MRVLIAGGSGLIGRALAAELERGGYEVIVLSRPLAKTGDYRRPQPAVSLQLPESVRVVAWDGRTAGGWEALADGACAIVNLAGETLAGSRWTVERKRRILESRVNAGRAVVQAVHAAAHRPQVVIQSSGVGYYGPHADEQVDEYAPAGSDFLGRVCVDWERSTAPLAELGVRRAIIRSGLVLSAQGGAFPRLILPFRFFVGGPLGSGQQWFSWIHIADEVAAIRFLIESDGAAGPFNLSAPVPLTNRAFGQVLGRVMGRPSLMPTPGLALRLLFGEMATALLDGQRAVPRHLLEMGFIFRFRELEPALRHLLTGEN